MFGLFKPRENAIPVKDTIWMSETWKFKKMHAEWESSPEAITFVGWFQDTIDKAAAFFSGITDLPIVHYRQANSSHVRNKRVIFLEHHPELSKENQLYQSLGLHSVEVWSSMDEPIFQLFGGDRVLQMMKQLGMKEDEPIEHKMISSSIRNAQNKIAKKISSDNHAESQGEWILKNLKKEY